jgi:hypothetical protein
MVSISGKGLVVSFMETVLFYCSVLFDIAIFLILFSIKFLKAKNFNIF